MRTLSATLLAYQKKANLKPLVKIYTNGTYYYPPQILDIDKYDYHWSNTAKVILDNSKNEFKDVDFVGQNVAIYWGLKTSAGDEYSQAPPYTCVAQQFISVPGGLQCILNLNGIFDMMATDYANAPYTPTEDDTLTVYDLVKLITGDETTLLDCFSHCEAIPVDWTSIDSLMDPSTGFYPKDSFRIYEGGSRLEALRRIVGYTGCVIRPKVGSNPASKLLEVFVPKLVYVVPEE
jgi:hypothetical protein